MKQFTGKHSNLSSFISQVKTLKETFPFHLASNHSNYLSQMYFNIFYSGFTSWALTSLIMPVGITLKALRENPAPNIGQPQRALYIYKL